MPEHGISNALERSSTSRFKLAALSDPEGTGVVADRPGAGATRFDSVRVQAHEQILVRVALADVVIELTSTWVCVCALAHVTRDILIGSRVGLDQELNAVPHASHLSNEVVWHVAVVDQSKTSTGADSQPNIIVFQFSFHGLEHDGSRQVASVGHDVALRTRVELHGHSVGELLGLVVVRHEINDSRTPGAVVIAARLVTGAVVGTRLVAGAVVGTRLVTGAVVSIRVTG